MLLIGFSFAVFQLWIITVESEMKATTTSDKANSHQCISVRSAKFLSHSLPKYHAAGAAITKAMAIMTAAFVSLLPLAQVDESSLMFLQNVPVFRENRI